MFDARNIFARWIKSIYSRRSCWFSWNYDIASRPLLVCPFTFLFLSSLVCGPDFANGLRIRIIFNKKSFKSRYIISYFCILAAASIIICIFIFLDNLKLYLQSQRFKVKDFKIFFTVKYFNIICQLIFFSKNYSKVYRK